MRIFGVLRAFQESFALKAAIELDVFTAIADGAHSAPDLASKCAASERGIRILCDTLVTCGLLRKEDGRYENESDSGIFLNRHSPAYVGGAAMFLCLPEMTTNMLESLTDCVRKGGTAMPGEGTVDPNNPLWVTFARAMAPLMRLPASNMAGQLPANGPLKVLDIAAGHGTFGIAVAQRNPDAKITPWIGRLSSR